MKNWRQKPDLVNAGPPLSPLQDPAWGSNVESAQIVLNDFWFCGNLLLTVSMTRGPAFEKR